MSAPKPTQGSTPPPRPALFVLLAALSVLPVTAHLPALADIADTYGTGAATVNLSIAGYAVAAVAAEATSGALADRYGRRRVVLVSITVFVLASLGCALATTVELFLLCRVSQAAIAACFPVAMVALRASAHTDDAVRRLGRAGMFWALAPMLGTVVGGTLAQHAGWRSIFLALTALGGLVLVVVLRHVGEAAAHAGAHRPGFGRALPHILGSASFWTLSLCMAFSMGTLYVFLGGAPLVMEHQYGASGTALGLYMAMVPAGFVAGGLVAGPLGDRLPREHLLVVARLLTCAGLLAGMLAATALPLHPLVLFSACAFVGVGNGITTPVVNAGVMSVRDDAAGTALGLSAAVGIGGGALVSMAAGPALETTVSADQLLVLLLAPSALALVAALVGAAVERTRRTVPG
ncbi:MFS transporter [Nocardiopsis sp. NPDC007018]|uniref:MFS transporter n=1 Tax=Nocardiopsis sp. NPDC007018 TaxID=3155721 RepID=UPI0033CEE1BD